MICLKSAVWFLAVCAVVYLAGAFTAWSLDPAEWGESERQMFAMIALIYGPGAAVIPFVPRMIGDTKETQ